MRSILNPFRKYSWLFILWFIMGESSLGFAQYAKPDLQEISLKEIKGIAKNALRTGDTYTALFYYEAWANEKPKDVKVVYQTAELYRESRNYLKAEEWYLKSLEMDAEKEPRAFFYLAKVQMSLKKYKEAKENFLVFKKKSADLKDPAYRRLTKNGLLSCDYALQQTDSSKSSAVKHLDASINKAHIEFSPFLYDEETLIFGSLRESNLNFYDVELQDSLKLPTRKLYVAKKEDDKWTAKGELNGPFNDASVNLGNAAINLNKDRIYFTKCAKNWYGKMICHLYYSDKGNKGWKAAVKMNELINLSNYTTTQITIGKDFKKNTELIYFVSDRPGGKGDLDVWYTEHDPRKNTYKEPRNAGSKINTAGKETTPYYDIETHRLYFSSDGHPGIGGLDVFNAIGEKRKWEKLTNMERDINSPADDLYFSLNESKKGGFLVSNRVGGEALLSPTCCDDIYAFSFNKFIDIQYAGRVMDSMDCIKNYVLSMYIQDSSKSEKYLVKRIEMDDCNYTLQLQQGMRYVIEVEKEGYFNYVEEVSTENIISSTTIEKEVSISKIPDQPMVLPNILYEFNSAALTTESMETIDNYLYKLLIDNPEIIVLLAAHTDSKGSEAYNLNLSQKRAASVVNYLIKKGISRERLKSKGFGESKPIAPNTHPDGSDNPEGRSKNRRTELEVIGKLKIGIEE